MADSAPIFSPDFRPHPLPYADLHCDFLSYSADFGRANPPENRGGNGGNGGKVEKNGTAAPPTLAAQFDLFRRGGCKLQCFALFCKGEADSDRREIENQLALFRAVRPAFEEITGGKAVLTVEGGAASRGDLPALKNLFDSVVKIFSPVWNTKNSLSAPNGAAGGLTAKGKAAMAYALERGAIPDISHASDGAARDIFALAGERKAAVCATHSLVRALCPHKRNLTDTQIKKIADSGGVVGVCFVREFAGNCGLTQHVRYLTEKGGENCVAIGGDFYGTENPYPESPAAMPDFFRSLERLFTPRQIEKFAYFNAARLLS